MKRIASFLITASVLFGLYGCGGGGGSSSGGGGGGGGSTTTRVVFDINWPDRSRSIDALSSALSGELILTGANADNSDFHYVFNRDAVLTAHSSHLVSSGLTRVGTWTASFKLYSQANATGAVVGSAGATVVLASDGTGLPALSLTGTIQSVTVATSQNVAIGVKKDLVFSAKDGSGATIAVSAGSATWQVVDGGAFVRFTGGQAEGLALGDAHITATIDGKVSPSVLLTVGPVDGTLNVTVADFTGTAITGSLITVKQGGTQVAQATSATGTQVFNNILPGATDVIVTKSGFNDSTTSITALRGTTVNVPVTLQAKGSPTASAGGARVTGNTTTSVTFDLNVQVIDAFGTPVTSLTAADFSIPDTVSGATTYSFAKLGATRVSLTGAGPYSAFLLLDASDSVGTVDPAGSRFQAVKTFFNALGPSDNAMFGYFPLSGGSPDMQFYPAIGFVNPGTPYYSLIDGLSKKTFAGTPLYNATIEAINETSSRATNSNKAVVVFTDGKNTGSAATLDQVVAAATSKSVKVYTVGLGTGTNPQTLAEMAQRTGGIAMHASDATQLVSFYRTLGALLSGSGEYYRTSWTVTKSAGTFISGEKVNGTVQIQLGGTTLSAPFQVQAP